MTKIMGFLFIQTINKKHTAAEQDALWIRLRAFRSTAQLGLKASGVTCGPALLSLTSGDTQFASSVLHHPHPRPLMHQLGLQHAFSPTLHPPACVRPAAAGTGAQGGSRLHRTLFPAGAALHRATHKSRSTKVTGRWGALHVCIAWKIYYHKQLRRVQESPSSYRELLTSEGPSSRPDSGRHTDDTHPSYMHPYLQSQRGRFVYGDGSEERQTPPAVSRHRRYPAHLHMAPTRRGSPEDGGGKPQPRASPELDGGRRKRPFECEALEKVKRAKRDAVDFHPHPSHFVASRSYGVQVQHLSDLSAVYSGSSRFNVCYPASWEPSWDTCERLELQAGRNVPRDTSPSPRRANRTLCATERQRDEVLPGFFTPPLCFPLALRSRSPLQGAAASCWPSGSVLSGPAGLRRPPDRNTQQTCYSQRGRDVRRLGGISG